MPHKPGEVGRSPAEALAGASVKVQVNNQSATELLSMIEGIVYPLERHGKTVKLRNAASKVLDAAGELRKQLMRLEDVMMLG